MTLKEFIGFLKCNNEKKIHFILPSNKFLPLNFHVTEVGLSQKHFVDCGGTYRNKESIQIQLWNSTDTEHFILASKFESIVEKSIGGLKTFFNSNLDYESLLVEVEYEDENDTSSIYTVESCELSSNGCNFRLGSIHTTCLAPEKCGVEANCC